jgi:U3 small nucleolar RNA-associated protein 3
MQRLLTLKQSVSTLEDLGFVFSDSEPEFDEDDDESLDLTDEEEYLEDISSWPEKKRLEPGELDDLLEDARTSVSFALPEPPVVRPPTVEPPKKKRKLSSETAKIAITPVFDLQEPVFTPSTKSNPTNGDVDDAYGEAMHLLAADAADKGARKKSLRFHTSKIESTSAKRRGARNQAVSGDDDIPYRERRKDKETRLAQEAKKRVGNQGGEDLDDSDPPERTSEKRRREADNADDDEEQSDADGYYELVKKKSKEKKEQKKVEYETKKASQ